MGHRMELYVSPDDAQAIIDIAAAFNLEARIVGRCEAAPSRKLTIKSEFGEFYY
jgi:phosphoribosylformylglycinamidine cyclo-ligase